MMYEYQITIGLFDQHAEKQLISSDAAKGIIASMIKGYHLPGATMIDCMGIWAHPQTGAIIREPSIRLEIASDNDIDPIIVDMIQSIKLELNQYSIMLKRSQSDIDFI